MLGSSSTSRMFGVFIDTPHIQQQRTKLTRDPDCEFEALLRELHSMGPPARASARKAYRYLNIKNQRELRERSQELLRAQVFTIAAMGDKTRNRSPGECRAAQGRSTTSKGNFLFGGW